MSSILFSMASRPVDYIDRLLRYVGRQAIGADKQYLANFLQRSIARLIDTAVVLAAAYGFEALFVWLIDRGDVINEQYVIRSVQQATPALALILWTIAYSPIMESTGGTLGKRLVGIRLVELKTGALPPFRIVAARAWIYLIFVILLFVPAIVSCLAYFFSDLRQTWHDRLTGIICVRTSRLKELSD